MREIHIVIRTEKQGEALDNDLGYVLAVLTCRVKLGAFRGSGGFVLEPFGQTTGEVTVEELPEDRVSAAAHQARVRQADRQRATLSKGDLAVRIYDLEESVTNHKASLVAHGARIFKLEGALAQLAGDREASTPLQAVDDQIGRLADSERKLLARLDNLTNAIQTIEASMLKFDERINRLEISMRPDET